MSSANVPRRLLVLVTFACFVEAGVPVVFGADAGKAFRFDH